MKEHPIIFSGEMVRAILNGTKTQTRRVIKPQPPGDFIGPEMYSPVRYDKDGEMYPGQPVFGIYDHFGEYGVACPYGQTGDRLWVKESFIVTPPCWADRETDYNIRDDKGEGRIISYCATCHPDSIRCANDYHLRVKPSIFMPRWASRITLEITGVRVERVQDISEDDAIAEGMEKGEYYTTDGDRVECFDRLVLRDLYRATWDTLNAKRGYPWESNPWVWVIEFRQVKP